MCVRFSFCFILILGCNLNFAQDVGTSKDTPEKLSTSPAAIELDDEEPSATLNEVPKITEKKPMSFWMEQKLDFSRSILRDLTFADYEALTKDAKQMRILSKIEGFVRRKNPDYRKQLRRFDSALQDLIRHAEKKNSDGATLAFTKMASSCVACHTAMRGGPGIGILPRNRHPAEQSLE